MGRPAKILSMAPERKYHIGGKRLQPLWSLPPREKRLLERHPINTLVTPAKPPNHRSGQPIMRRGVVIKLLRRAGRTEVLE